jgi:hypothetical protein
LPLTLRAFFQLSSDGLFEVLSGEVVEFHVRMSGLADLPDKEGYQLMVFFTLSSGTTGVGRPAYGG